MRKESKLQSRLVTSILFLAFMLSITLMPAQVTAQTQVKDLTYCLIGSDVFKVKQMQGAPQIYEFLCNDNVVLRYRSMAQGLSAKERSMAILERTKEMGSSLKEGSIKVDCLNGCSVVTVNGKLFITVTEADFKSNKSTPDGLARIWAEKLRKAREYRQERDDELCNSPSGNNCSGNEQSEAKPPETPSPEPPSPEAPKVTPPEAEEPQENLPGEENSDNTVIASAEERQMLELINAERVKAGARPLTMKPELVKIARLKSKDMIDKNYFDHTSPTYGDPFTMMRDFGIKFGYAGENLAGNPSLTSAHASLMASPGHRQNILNPNFTHVGIGIVNGGTYGKIFTQLFISE